MTPIPRSSTSSMTHVALPQITQAGAGARCATSGVGGQGIVGTQNRSKRGRRPAATRRTPRRPHPTVASPSQSWGRLAAEQKCAVSISGSSSLRLLEVPATAARRSLRDGGPCCWRKPGKLRPSYDIGVLPQNQMSALQGMPEARRAPCKVAKARLCHQGVAGAAGRANETFHRAAAEYRACSSNGGVSSVSHRRGEDLFCILAGNQKARFSLDAPSEVIASAARGKTRARQAAEDRAGGACARVRALALAAAL